MTRSSSVSKNLDKIVWAMRRAEIAASMPEGRCAVMAVTKKQDDVAVDDALFAGLRLFGENRVQEARQRWRERKSLYPDLRLHMIGPLQTNKVREAVALFDCIETLDRDALAAALAKECAEQGRAADCLIQVNVGEESQKAGIFPRDLHAFHEYCVQDCKLQVKGLMCLPPQNEPAALYFAFLKTLAQRLDLSVLSMGMSGDYEKAAALGATHVRLGTSLFGERPAAA